MERRRMAAPTVSAQGLGGMGLSHACGTPLSPQAAEALLPWCGTQAARLRSARPANRSSRIASAATPAIRRSSTFAGD